MAPRPREVPSEIGGPRAASETASAETEAAPGVTGPVDEMPALVDQTLAAVIARAETLRLPTATYRVQFNSGCTFRDVQPIVPYLYALGVSDVYASPFLRACPGSPHGYDIVDHSTINPEIGTLDELRALRSALREHDMGLIADVVPNHMSNTPRLNAWWQDVLENGPSSSFAAYFDIDWMPLKPDLANKVLLPMLGDQLGKVLEDGQLVVRYGAGSFWLEYFEHRFPLGPRSYALILEPSLAKLESQLGRDHPEMLELLSILTSLRNLPHRTETNPDRLAERRREKEIVKRRLHELVERSRPLAEFVESSVREINGRLGEPRSFDRLDELLQDQAYRLAYWRVASDEINYRRFFDINELAAICTEHPQVFAETHRLLFDLLDEGTLTGLRIDHPDGLYDPRGYLCQLQQHRFLRFCRGERTANGRASESRVEPHVGSQDGSQDGAQVECSGGTPGQASGERGDDQLDAVEQRLLELWQSAQGIPGSPLSRLVYVVVEKILAHGEALPDNWPVHGTVGYEFLNTVNGLFVAPSGERPMSALYARFSGNTLDFDELAYQCKRLIVKMSMSSELSVLGYRLDRISERNRRTRDFTLQSLTRALQEIMACFRVYRTYVEREQLLDRDRRYIGLAVARAKRLNPAMSSSIFDFVHDVLLLKYHDNADEDERLAVRQFVGKFQQLTGPIMAKAVEDTAFYRFNRLVSLNEVGGDPARFGTPVGDFHRLNQSRLPRLTHTMNATSTHDTKRGEDVRTRIDVLSEVVREWRDHVRRWSRWHRQLTSDIEGREAPSRNSQFLLYQTLIGIWPGAIPQGDSLDVFVERVQQYMLKVVREAKVNTSWVNPHEAYEAALVRFVRGVLSPSRRNRFLQELSEFAGKVADHGRWNALSQLVLKVGSPGVPDFYQGTETWTLTLVDPDNRRPVDFSARRAELALLLGDMAAALDLPASRDAAEDWLASNGRPAIRDFLERLIATRADGRIKQFVTLVSLRVRRQLAELFTVGEYVPLATTGKYADHVIAFARRHGNRAAVVIAPRFTVAIGGFGGPPPLGDLWDDTAIQLPDMRSPAAWRDVFTRESLAASSSLLRAADVFRAFPVAILLFPSTAH